MDTSTRQQGGIPLLPLNSSRSSRSYLEKRTRCRSRKRRRANPIPRSHVTSLPGPNKPTCPETHTVLRFPHSRPIHREGNPSMPRPRIPLRPRPPVSPVPAHWAPRVPIAYRPDPAAPPPPCFFHTISNPTTTHAAPKRSPVLRLAWLRCAHRTPRRRGSPRLRPDRPIDPAGGGRHGLPQPRGRGAAGRGCGGGRGGRLVLVAQRRCGSGCVVRGAGAQEGVGAAQGARVHGQGAHQPHASLCGGEAELHLPRGHPVRAARSLPCPTSRPPCYLLPPTRELRPSRNLMCGARFDRMAPWLNLLC